MKSHRTLFLVTAILHAQEVVSFDPLYMDGPMPLWQEALILVAIIAVIVTIERAYHRVVAARR
jgi:hypothetical protein